VRYKEQRSYIHFSGQIFMPKGVSANAIHIEINPMYGDKCFTRSAVHVWCKKFAHCRENVDE